MKQALIGFAMVFSGVFVSLYLYTPSRNVNLGGGVSNMQPRIKSFASSTIFLVPHDEALIPGSKSDLLFGTTTTRTYARIHATTSMDSILITFDDLPCSLHNARTFIPSGVLVSNAVTASTNTPALIINKEFPYTGAIRVCGRVGTTSLMAIQSIIQP